MKYYWVNKINARSPSERRKFEVDESRGKSENFQKSINE